MREAINIPENDRFIIVSEHDADDLSIDRHYLGIQRSDDFVAVQITLRRGRSVELKQALYRRITERLSEAPGVRPADVFVTLVENGPEDWSFGDGVAQYVK
jgi:phenylpyruvate tautomerase PptA (4-oxalocrotonate tautomerase family)